MSKIQRKQPTKKMEAEEGKRKEIKGLRKTRKD
jgi:hypothetical protein